VRVDEHRAADAYRRGLWVRSTLADSLRDATRRTPERTVVVDGDSRLDCHTLHDRACALAHTLMARMPAGSVVSFMLPNWHEAAVIYLGATLAGMVVNPVLPSLRDRELQFILSDAGSRAIFIPAGFGSINEQASFIIQAAAYAFSAGMTKVFQFQFQDDGRGEGRYRPRERGQPEADPENQRGSGHGRYRAEAVDEAQHHGLGHDHGDGVHRVDETVRTGTEPARAYGQRQRHQLLHVDDIEAMAS